MVRVVVDEVDHWPVSLSRVLARALREGRVLYECPWVGALSIVGAIFRHVARAIPLGNPSLLLPLEGGRSSGGLTGFAVRAGAAPTFARRRSISAGDPLPTSPGQGEESEGRGRGRGAERGVGVLTPSPTEFPSAIALAAWPGALAAPARRRVY